MYQILNANNFFNINRRMMKLVAFERTDFKVLFQQCIYNLYCDSSNILAKEQFRNMIFEEEIKAMKYLWARHGFSHSLPFNGLVMNLVTRVLLSTPSFHYPHPLLPIHCFSIPLLRCFIALLEKKKERTNPKIIWLTW